MGNKVTVDRIEGQIATLLLREDEKIKFNLPVVLLPGIVEGDIVDITITKDTSSTNEVKGRVISLIEKLKNKSR